MSKELNFKQELTAAFGQPISENPTQVMVEAAYRHHGLDWRYLTIEVGPDDLETAVNGAKAMGFQGFNCTIPHKVKVIEYLDPERTAVRTQNATDGALEGAAREHGGPFAEVIRVLDTNSGDWTDQYWSDFDDMVVFGKRRTRSIQWRYWF